MTAVNDSNWHLMDMRFFLHSPKYIRLLPTTKAPMSPPLKSLPGVPGSAPLSLPSSMMLFDAGIREACVSSSPTCKQAGRDLPLPFPRWDQAPCLLTKTLSITGDDWNLASGGLGGHLGNHRIFPRLEKTQQPCHSGIEQMTDITGPRSQGMEPGREKQHPCLLIFNATQLNAR